VGVDDMYYIWSWVFIMSLRVFYWYGYMEVKTDTEYNGTAHVSGSDN
jgi:hypothetical protein